MRQECLHIVDDYANAVDKNLNGVVAQAPW